VALREAGVCGQVGHLTIMSTHWDHESPSSRLESARIVERLAADALGRYPTAVLLLGDLNEAAPASVPRVVRRPVPLPPSLAYQALVQAGFADAVELAIAGHGGASPLGPASSFVGFFHDAPVGGGRVDHVLVRMPADADARPRLVVAVPLAGIVPTDDERGPLPSDHRPVVADLILSVAPTLDGPPPPA
jgi:endonuclease/exonuclease/phosphatase family metal-dependent hydrolase